VVDNADMQRVAGTQRVRVRLLWDDQKMRQTMAAAYGLDRLGKTMAAAYGLDRLGKAMTAAYGLDKVGKAMTAAHRERMRPLFNTRSSSGRCSAASSSGLPKPWPRPTERRCGRRWTPRR
jgi:hypothetical protein